MGVSDSTRRRRLEPESWRRLARSLTTWRSSAWRDRRADWRVAGRQGPTFWRRRSRTEPDRTSACPERRRRRAAAGRRQTLRRRFWTRDCEDWRRRRAPALRRATQDEISRRRSGAPTRRCASQGALASAASDAPISAFERFAAGRGLSPPPGAAAQGAAAAGATPERCAFRFGATRRACGAARARTSVEIAGFTRLALTKRSGWPAPARRRRR